MTPVPTQTSRNANGASAPAPTPPGAGATPSSTQPSNPQPSSSDAGPPPGPPSSVQSLSNEALEFAAKMFDLARTGSDSLIPYLTSGLPPNLTNNRGDTLLMLASYHGHSSLVRSMLEAAIPNPSNDPLRFVDPNQLNARGQSCLAGAIFKDYREVVEVLVRHGADPLAGNPNAEETARMFERWEDRLDADGNVVGEGYGRLLEGASGRGKGGREVGQAVEDREEVRRVPGSGPVQA